jgi:hypothetical protein
MKTRTLIMIVLPVVAVSFGLAQQPRQVQRRPVERPLHKLAVKVIDIRTASAVRAKVAAVRDARVAVIPMPGQGVVAQALTMGQLKATFHDAGLADIQPTNEYVRFTPTQLSVEGKGHMLCQAPLWAEASHFIFNTSVDENQWYDIHCGPLITLKEPGAFVLDFQIEIQADQPGQNYLCDVIKGKDIFQEITLTQETSGPQHLLVVFQQGAPPPTQIYPWVGIRIRSSVQRNPPDFVRWMLYQVVVTKI